MAFLELDHFRGPVDEVSRDLVGRTLVVQRGELTHRALIVETEAYGGPDDAASHAAFKPNGGARIMRERPGLVYVYLAYGMYPCLNIVTGDEGLASAVLIRGALVDTVGNVVSGPGRLGRALGVTIDDNGLACNGPVFQVTESRQTLPVIATPRIGITRAIDTPWRFLATLE